MATRPTILDVAKRAGVSKSTVSNVIRGEPRVAQQNRDRVIKAIEELGYRRNAAARSLVRQRTDVLGVVVGDFVNPFHAEMAALLEQEAARRGFTTLLATTGGDPDVESARVRVLLEHNVAAIVFLAFSGSEVPLGRVPSDTPQIFVSFRSELGPSVSVDEVTGATLAVSHLTNLGHRRIGYVSTTLGAELQTDDARFDGYRSVLRNASLPVDEEIVLRVGADSWITGRSRSILQGYLTHAARPTAIFAGSDYTALEIMDCADQLGIRIPDELSLVGFDNIAISSLDRISLTTVAQPMRELARAGVETAIAAVEGGAQSPAPLAPSLIVRSSTAPSSD